MQSVLTVLTIAYAAVLVLALAAGLIAIALYLNAARRDVAAIARELRVVESNVAPLGEVLGAVNTNLARVAENLEEVDRNLAELESRRMTRAGGGGAA